MKKEFSLDELLKSKGCYSSEKIHELFPEDRTYSIIELSNLPIPLKDKVWFIYKKCELTQAEKLDLCVLLGKAVAPLYSNKYPDDTRISDCWKAIDDYREQKISIDELKEKRKNASAAAYAAADAHAYAYAAAYAAADAAYAYAADATYDAAYAAAYATAADKAYSIHYSEVLNNILIEFFNKCE